MFSADTDLLPALEAVHEMKGPGAVEVATWRPDPGKHPSRLNLATERLWCHYLDATAFQRVRDLTDYNQKTRGPRRRK